MSLTKTEQDGALVTITLCNQAKRNILSADMINGILAGLDEARRVKARTVILRAEPGCKVWSAGHDVSELPEAHRDPLGWSDPLRVIIRAIEDFHAPVIALVEGTVWGGACEVTLACDMVIATPEATFAITPAKLGIPYNASGLLTMMNAMSIHVVREMAFTALPITAQRALALGIINHIVEADAITAFCHDMAAGIAKLAPLAIAVMKEELRVLASAHSITPRMFERVQGLRRQVYDSNDYHEGIRAFMERRPPNFTGE